MVHIVVIGAGPAGLAFAQTAASKLCNKTISTKKNSSSSTSNDSDAAGPKVEITVLEKRDYFYHTIGSLRAMVDESFIKKIFIPFDNALQGYEGARIVTKANVLSIDYASKVVKYMKDAEMCSLSYNYLILATGSSYTHPIKPNPPFATSQDNVGESQNAIEKSLYEINQKIKASNRILVVGGGAVGIEMAGELKSFYPEKKIMLLSSSTELLPNQNVPKMRRHVKEALEKLGVELLLGQRIKRNMLPSIVGSNQQHHQFGTRSLQTEKGLVIESDAQLLCLGMSPNADLMTDPNCLEQVSASSKPAIKVKDNFQLLAEGDSEHLHYDSVFVIGDASNHSTPKLAYWGMEQGKHLGKSLADNILYGTTLKQFRGPSTETLILPIGPDGGVSQLPLCGGMIVGNFFTRMIKSKTLFLEMFRKQLLHAADDV